MPSSSATSSSSSSTSSLNDQLDQLTFGLNAYSPPSQPLTNASNSNEIAGFKSSSSASSSSSSSSSASTCSSKSSSASLNQFHRHNMQQFHVDTNCSLCAKKLTKPKLLSCLHTFCKTCLNAYIIRESGDSMPPNFVCCPKCKQETELPGNGGIDALQDDCVMQNQLDMIDIERMILDCTSCKTEEKAVARCADCAQFLCPNCVSAHQYMRCFENHKVVKFEEIKQIYKQNLIKLSENCVDNETTSSINIQIDCGVPIHKPLFCKSHSNESLKFFCNTCQVAICSDCVATYHPSQSHTYERITDSESFKHVEDLDLMMRKAKDNISYCQAEFQTLDQYLGELQEQLDLGRGLINETYQSYKVLLEKKRDELLKELDEKHSSKELLIMETHNNIDISINKLNEAVKFTERVIHNGNSSEILLLKKSIAEQIRYLITNLPQAENIDTNLKFFTDEKQFLKALNETFGRFYTQKELKMTYLNNLTSTSTSNNTLINASESNGNISSMKVSQKIQQLQKQYALSQQQPQQNNNQRSESNNTIINMSAEQEWIMANLINGNVKSNKASSSSSKSNPIGQQSSQLNENFLSSLSHQQLLQLQQYFQQNNQSALSPTDSSSNDDWLTNIVKLPGSNGQFEDPSQKMHSAISPAQSTGSSSSNGQTQWPIGYGNSNSHNTNQINLQNQMVFNNLNNLQHSGQYLNMQQRVQSPLDPPLNLIKHQQQQQQHQHYQNFSASRSQTPANLLNGHKSSNELTSNSGINVGLNSIGSSGSSGCSTVGSNIQLINSIDDFSNTNSSSIAQNFNQLTKMITPHQHNNNLNDLNALTNLNELAITASQNGILINQNGYSDSNSPQSPILNGIDSNINMANINNMMIAAALTNNTEMSKETQFAGNGNLNPPVRQNGKMTNMSINSKFGALGAAKSQFNSPHGFCLGYEGEEIIVADTNNHRIQVFSTTGEFKHAFGSPGREEGQLWYPRKVTVMRGSSKFVVCDRGNERSRMQIFSKTGQFLKKISIRYIDIVAGIAITQNGEIVAVDSVSPTVFRISEEGDLLKWFDCSDQMREPSDIAINGNEYFVCDFKGHCVVVFNEEGSFLRRIGGENITNFPNGIDVSDAGDVLVGDSHGNRFHVAVFSRDGTMLSEFECPYVKVSRCCGLKITTEGHIVTLAKNNHHVLILNTLYLS